VGIIMTERLIVADMILGESLHVRYDITSI
jgi:hypothetical protein